ncbi:MAG: hypothetical protein ABI041_10255, partial [Bdellovibrionia bacterium]
VAQGASEASKAAEVAKTARLAVAAELGRAAKLSRVAQGASEASKAAEVAKTARLAEAADLGKAARVAREAAKGGGSVADDAATAAGKAAGGVADDAATAAGKGTAGVADDAAKTAGKGAAGAADDVAKAATKAGTETAETGAKAAKGMSKLERGAACLSMTMAAVAAGFKWKNFTVLRANEDAECKEANKLGFPVEAKPQVSTENTQASSGGGSRISFSGGGTVGTKGANSGMAGHIEEMTNNFPGASFSAATADPFAKMFGPMPNKAQIPEFLDKLGTSLNDIQHKLQNGSPAAAINSILNPPESAAAIIEATQNATMTKSMDSDGSVMKGGGGGGRSEGSSEAAFNPMAFFGGAKEKEAEATGTVSFGAKTSVAAPESTDIWHPGSKLSIFQIVSGRLKHSEPRVEQLDWAFPLNRAMHGLPAVPKK